MADLTSFMDEPAIQTYVPSREEAERRHRIRLSVFAYAYEYEATSLISDVEYDKLSREVDLTIPTGNSKLDKWFKKNFEPDTGMWIRKHPELAKVRALCFMWKNNFDGRYCRIGAQVYDFGNGAKND